MSLKDRALAIPHLLKLVQSKMKQDRNGAVTLVEVSNPYEEIVLVGKKTHTHTFNIINLCPHVARVEIEMQHAPRDAGIRIRMEPSMFVLGGHASMKVRPSTPCVVNALASPDKKFATTLTVASDLSAREE